MEQHLRMRESAEQHGRPTVPVSGLYFRMEDHDHTKRFKNHMRLKLLGTVAWLEFPTRKRRRQFVLPLSPDGEDAIRIDWSPAYPEWKSGRLQLVVEEGERGIREKEEVFWKLHTEYSQEEVEKHLEAARSSSRSGSPVAMLMDGELTDEDVAVSSTSCKRQKKHKLPSPLPQLEDAVDASAAASASPDVAETHSSGEEIVLTSNLLAQRRGGAREWLDGPRA